MKDIAVAHAVTPGHSLLMTDYSSILSNLKIAHVGNVRAVLGRRSAGNGWYVVQSTDDHTVSNADGVARVQAEHKGECDLVKDNFSLGFPTSRCIGNSQLKWSRELQEQARHRFGSPPPLPEQFDSPPYSTADPSIKMRKVDPERGDFLILVTSDMWDLLTNQNAVDLV